MTRSTRTTVSNPLDIIYGKPLEVAMTASGELSSEVAEMICPVCGYYYLGHGGVLCIDKLKLYEDVQALEAGVK